MSLSIANVNIKLVLIPARSSPGYHCVCVSLSLSLSLALALALSLSRSLALSLSRSLALSLSLCLSLYIYFCYHSHSLHSFSSEKSHNGSQSRNAVQLNKCNILSDSIFDRSIGNIICLQLQLLCLLSAPKISWLACMSCLTIPESQAIYQNEIEIDVRKCPPILHRLSAGIRYKLDESARHKRCPTVQQRKHATTLDRVKKTIPPPAGHICILNIPCILFSIRQICISTNGTTCKCIASLLQHPRGKDMCRVITHHRS